MTVRSRLAFLTIAGVVIAAGCNPPGQTPAPGTTTPAPTTTVTMTFDGGFAFVQQEDRTMHVDAVSDRHPMFLLLGSGTVEGQPSTTSWKLEGKRFVLETQGTDGAVELPPVREIRQPGDSTKCTSDPPEQSSHSNNGFYIPELTAWAGGTINETPKTLHAQVALKGGRLKILRAGGCFELRDPSGKTVFHRPLVLGRQSVSFTGVVSQAKVTLNLEPLERGPAAQSLTLVPDSRGRIELGVGHRGLNEKEPGISQPKLPAKVEDFRMYDELLSVSQSSKHTLFLHRTPPPRFPSDECIPIFLTKVPPPPCPDPDLCPLMSQGRVK